MGERLDINTLMRILDDNPLKAIEYMNSFVPEYLYKYSPLLGEHYIDYEEENNKKLETLENNQIWVSNYKVLNDPFEFKMFVLDKERLEKYGWNKDFVENIVENTFESIRERILVTSFTNKVNNNMPLWAHYANNHSGYCVKYRVLSPKIIFPVFYEPVRVKIAKIPASIISEMLNLYEQKLNKPAKEYDMFNILLYLSFLCKHEIWSYENEFRILYPWYIPTKKGLNISLDEAGLVVDSIYIGFKCNEEYEERLINIGKDLNCKVYKMIFDDYSIAYELSMKRIR
jgi:hypothetical protein